MRFHPRAQAFGLLATLAALLAPGAAPAQSLTYTHLAGTGGGPGFTDANGTAARFVAPWGIAVDAAGNVFVGDAVTFNIRKATPAGDVTTLAGSMGGYGSADGKGSGARFFSPVGLAVDGAGNLYVADAGIHAIRKVTPAGVVTTVAGLGFASGSADGTGSAARFYSPTSVALDGAGNIYVADRSNHTVRKVTPAGVVTTLAGLALNPGTANGTGSAARFSQPTGVAVDASGNVLVAEWGNNAIRKVTPAGVVTTFVGLPGTSGGTDGTGTAARFNGPIGVAVDGAGMIYVTEQTNGTVRKVTPAGVVTTLAGWPGQRYFADGTGTAARFTSPAGLAATPAGVLYVADSGSNSIRRVAPDGTVTTVLGLPPVPGTADGTGTAARFNSPRGLVLDAQGNAWVADTYNHAIRRVTPAGAVTTPAGLAGFPGTADGTGSAARLSSPEGLAFDAAGNLWLTEGGNLTVRRVTPAGVVTTVAGLAGASGSTDGTGTAARFGFPRGIAIDASGNAWVADAGARTIRKVTPAGVVTTVAGLAGASGGADGTGSAARFGGPFGIAVNAAGNFLVADGGGATIRVVTPAGAVTTLAGLAGSGTCADGAGSAARFGNPAGIAVDAAGNAWVADAGCASIRKVTPAGVVTTVAGANYTTGTLDGTGTNARFNYPVGLAIDAAGNVVLADQSNNAILRGTAALADRATIPISPSVPAGKALFPAANPQTASAFKWDVLVRPTGSTAQPTPDTSPTPSFAPDVEGSYLLRLAATSASASSISLLGVGATAPDPSSLFLAGGKVSVKIAWRNQYTGATGTATAIPKGDQFGYFWFLDQANPEVFVKVLDWGSSTPYLLFWAGLTDFEYTVTFTNEATAKTYVVTKPAGQTVGGANTADLPHAAAVLWGKESGEVSEVPRGYLRRMEILSEARGTEPPDVAPPAAASAPASAAESAVPDAGNEMMLVNSQVGVTVTWRSPYNGQTGTATPLPQGDQFGFFWFLDQANPEVFVKVLDWGAQQPYLLFAAGLTDFEYTVTYRCVRTGQAVPWKKNAGAFDGYANATTLNH